LDHDAHANDIRDPTWGGPMRGRTPAQTIASSPTMVGAITTLIAVVAVFLAYNANSGLPFVPTYQVAVEIPNASRLTTNNEVRIGGHRVGVVESIEAIRPQDDASGSTETTAVEEKLGTSDPGEVIARLNLKLDQAAEPLPRDSTFRVRYRSAFGLKYLEIERGTGPPAPEGHVFGADQTVEQTEFDDINNTFDAPTRENVRTNLEGFGNALAGRGTSLNQAIEALNPLLTNLRPVARTLDAPDTVLRRFFPELGDAARIVAPVAVEQAELFTNAGIAFAAISSDLDALRETISEGVPTLETGIETLPRQRPFLRDFTTLSRLLNPGVEDLRVSLPSLNEAIEVGTPVLRRTPRMNEDLRRVFVETENLVDLPTTKLSLERLGELFDQAEPVAKHVVPAQTVCNYWNYWFTFIPEALSDRDQVGYSLRQSIVGFPLDDVEVQAPLGGYSGVQSNGRASALADPPTGGEFRPYDVPIVHANPYAPTGQPGPEYPDCQPGQSGYALGDLRVPGQPPSNPGLGVSDIPGSRGPTTLFYTEDGERQFRDTRVEGRYPNP
jgi:ABC-type transporter Mla subunit MlaD